MLNISNSKVICRALERYWDRRYIRLRLILLGLEEVFSCGFCSWSYRGENVILLSEKMIYLIEQ